MRRSRDAHIIELEKNADIELRSSVVNVEQLLLTVPKATFQKVKL